jgi:hypothetical protein
MNLIRGNRFLRPLLIWSVWTVLIFLSSCFAKQKVNHDFSASRYLLTVTLPPGTTYSALDSFLSESTTQNLNFKVDGTFQDLKLGSRSMSFLFSNEEDMNDFRKRLQSEGISIQIYSVQKLD